MKTTTLQKKNFIQLNRVETQIQKPRTVKADLAHRELEILIVGVSILGLLWRFFGAWIGRESIRLQKEPGKYTTRGEEFQDLHNQVGLNSFFRMH